MTIYTDPSSGKQYDRVRTGIKSGGTLTGTSKCEGCALDAAEVHPVCMTHCVSAHTKTVYFIFKERK